MTTCSQRTSTIGSMAFPESCRPLPATEFQQVWKYFARTFQFRTEETSRATFPSTPSQTAFFPCSSQQQQQTNISERNKGSGIGHRRPCPQSVPQFFPSSLLPPEFRFRLGSESSSGGGGSHRRYMEWNIESKPNKVRIVI